MTNETQNIWEVYKFLENNCSKIEMQGVPYSFIWRAYGNNVPDEVPIRVWDTSIDRSLLEKLKEKVPYAFNQSGNMLETVLKDLVLGIQLDKNSDNEVMFRKSLANLYGYEYSQSGEEAIDDCGETYWVKIPAKFEKIDARGEK